MRTTKLELIATWTAFFALALMLMFWPRAVHRQQQVEHLLAEHSELRLDLRIDYPAGRATRSAGEKIRSEEWQIRNVDGVTTAQYTVSGVSSAERVSVAANRTVSSAELYDALLANGFWNVGNEIQACRRADAVACYTVRVMAQKGPEKHDRTLVFDDLELRQDARREFHITLDEHRPVREQMPSMLVLQAARARDPRYAAFIAAFRAYGDARFHRNVETAKNELAGRATPSPR